VIRDLAQRPGRLARPVPCSQTSHFALGRHPSIFAPAASFHPAKLLDGGMIAVARQGRPQYRRSTALASSLCRFLHRLEPNPQRRGHLSSVRVTPAGAEGLARTFGLDLMGSCRSCEKSW